MFNAAHGVFLALLRRCRPVRKAKLHLEKIFENCEVAAIGVRLSPTIVQPQCPIAIRIQELMSKELFKIIPPSDAMPARGNQPKNCRGSVLEYSCPSSLGRSVNCESKIPSQLEKKSSAHDKCKDSSIDESLNDIPLPRRDIVNPEMRLHLFEHKLNFPAGSISSCDILSIKLFWRNIGNIKMVPSSILVLHTHQPEYSRHFTPFTLASSSGDLYFNLGIKYATLKPWEDTAKLLCFHAMAAPPVHPVRENYYWVGIFLKTSDKEFLVPVNRLKGAVVEVAHIKENKTAFHPMTYLHKFPAPGSLGIKPYHSMTYAHYAYHHVKLHDRFIAPVPSRFTKVFEHIMQFKDGRIYNYKIGKSFKRSLKALYRLRKPVTRMNDSLFHKQARLGG